MTTPNTTKCIAPECKDGLVFGVEVCRACKGTGYITRVYVVHEQYPHRDVQTFHTLEDAQDFIARNETLHYPVILITRK
jgi:hypothetical protein